MTTESNSTELATVFCNACFDFGTEMAHEALYRPGSSITEGTNGSPFDLFTVDGEMKD
jgi:hypothetical protein